MYRQKKRHLVAAMITKSLIAAAFTFYIMKDGYPGKPLPEIIFYEFFEFFLIYSLCSLIQIINSFTYTLLAALFSFYTLMVAYFSWRSLLPDAEEYGVRFVICLILSIIYISSFFLYDILRLMPNPVFIQKAVNFANAHELIDIPEVTTSAVKKLLCRIKKKNTPKEEKDDALQDTFSE